MWTWIKDTFGRKKIWWAVLGSAVVALAQQLELPNELIMTIAGFFGIAIGGQGLADFKKESAKLGK